MRKTKKSTQKLISPLYLADELSFDLFLDWANRNPEQFAKYYPELSEGMTVTINDHPELVAAMIEKLPELFPKWLAKANQLIGSAYTQELENIVSILDKFLNKIYTNEIIEHSRQKMEPLAMEYLEIVNSLLYPPTPERNKIGFKISSQQPQPL